MTARSAYRSRFLATRLGSRWKKSASLHFEMNVQKPKIKARRKHPPCLLQLSRCLNYLRLLPVVIAIASRLLVLCRLTRRARGVADRHLILLRRALRLILLGCPVRLRRPRHLGCLRYLLCLLCTTDGVRHLGKMPPIIVSARASPTLIVQCDPFHNIHPSARAKNVPKRYPATYLNGATPSE